MSYCEKINCSAVDKLTEKGLNEALNHCENCEKYSHCDTVCYMNDRLKEFYNELLRCPYCNKLYDPADCPDLFYHDANNTTGLNNQLGLLKELQSKGYNIVTCGDCGEVFIHKI